MQRLAARLAGWSARWVPGAFSIAAGLTAIVFALGLTLGDAGPVEVLDAWGGGVWTLLTFGMQMCLIVFCGTLLAVSPPARAALRAVAALPRGPRSAVALVAAASMVLSWLHWGMGLITSAVLVAFVARRRTDTDFRLLVAAAYLGLGATWHVGPSGSVPLLLATPDNFLVERGILDRTIPLSETVLTAPVLAFAGVVLVVLSALAAFLHPAPADTVALPPDRAAALVDFPEPPPPDGTPASRIEHSWLPNLVVGGAGLAWLVHRWATAGASLDLDTLNLLFLSLAVLAHGSPARLGAAVRRAAEPLHGIVLQFPLYAGMFGVISGTRLAERFAELLASASSPGAYPLVVCWYSAVLNYFVPSGGSKWAIEAPYILEAAARLGVDVPAVAVAYAVGDMGTNLVQPFWAIPLLAVARIEFREVIGFLAVLFVAYALLGSAFVLVAG